MKNIPMTRESKRSSKKVINHAVRNYDVRITLNKAGEEGRYVLRFGFLNKAAQSFADSNYIDISDVEKLPNRIYFEIFKDKEDQYLHKLSTNSNSRSRNLYTSFTVSKKAEKIYRMNWIGGTYNLQFDDECGLFYIENCSENK